MKYIKNLSQFLVEKLTNVTGKMKQLVDYFEKTSYQNFLMIIIHKYSPIGF
jgi:hypothetical protein